MAKYRLMKGGTQSVDCELLTEAAGSYIVRFSNGVVRDVPKENVYLLDEIDRQVLETVRMRNNESVIKNFRTNVPRYNSHVDESWDDVVDFGRRVIYKTKNAYNTVKNFFVGLIRRGNFIFFGVGNRALNTPVNAMEAANTKDCINFIPGDDVIEMCDEYGIEPKAVENFQYSDDYDFGVYDDILLSCLVDETNESYVCKNSLLPVNEDLSMKKDKVQSGTKTFAKNFGLPDEEMIVLKSVVEKFTDLSIDEIREYIFEEYEARYDDEISDDHAPIFIWGAPGIGKTSIVRGLINEIEKKSNGKKISVLSVCAGSLNPDSFTFPVKVTKTTKYNPETGESEDEEKTAKGKAKPESDSDSVFNKDFVDDLPKSWLPVYDPTEGDEKKKAIDMCLANYGIVDEKTGEITKEGDGGIFFIDEFIRMPQYAMGSLMNTPTTRNIGEGNKLKFGDRWVIVCASNRPSDLSRKTVSEAMDWELATMTRFYHVNFVPEVKDWIVWAKQPNKNKNLAAKGFKNMLSEIVEYIQNSPDDFYCAWKLPQSKPDGSMPRETPRSWAIVNSALINSFKKMYPESILVSSAIKNNYEKVYKHLRNVLGDGPAQKFIQYFEDKNNDNIFTTDMASEILNMNLSSFNVKGNGLVEMKGVKEDRYTTIRQKVKKSSGGDFLHAIFNKFNEVFLNDGNKDSDNIAKVFLFGIYCTRNPEQNRAVSSVPVGNVIRWFCEDLQVIDMASIQQAVRNGGNMMDLMVDALSNKYPKMTMYLNQVIGTETV